MAHAFTGTGDPGRTLALLWRAREQPAPKRGPRPSLDPDDVVRAAVAFADAEGLGAVSIRRLAARLGVGAMTLYSHVPGKGELVDLMYDAVLAEMYPDGPDGLGDDWRERLASVAWENWRLYQRHPWAVHVAVGRPPLGPGLLGRYETELLAFENIGIGDVDRDVLVTLISAFTRGLAAGEVERAEARRTTGITDMQWWQATEPYLEKVFDPERYPTATRVGRAAGQELQAAVDPTRTFTTGLDALLNGIAARHGLQ